MFRQVVGQLQQGDGLKAFQRLGGRTLVALDGTEYFCSQEPSCPQCRSASGRTVRQSIITPCWRPCRSPHGQVFVRGVEGCAHGQLAGATIIDETGKTTYDGAFVTSLPVTADNVVEVAACARARWKIENESFNVLKNNGYNLAHDFGHGKKYRARTFAAMNLLAFAFHTACDCLETLWQQARKAVGAHARFFQDLHTITAYVLFPSWHSFMD